MGGIWEASGTLGDPLGPFWLPLGCPLGSLGAPWGAQEVPQGAPKAYFEMRRLTLTSFLRIKSDVPKKTKIDEAKH